MAEHVSYSDDISTLWGSPGDTVLTAAPTHVKGLDAQSVEAAPANGNGSYPTPADAQIHADVSRLAEAIAANHADVVRRSDLDAVRSELESAITRQLAVALYELMAASNARFATAEDHINQRVNEAVEVHTSRLIQILESQRTAAGEASAEIWTELGALRQELAVPIDRLSEFQRDLRHEVGRLGDALRAQDREAVEGSDAAPEAGPGDVAETLTSVKDEIAALREELADLRAALADPRAKGRRSRRWSRTG